MDGKENAFLTRKEVSEYLKICITSVDNSGIPFVKIGRSVRYRKSDLDEYLEKNTRRSYGNSVCQSACGFEG